MYVYSANGGVSEFAGDYFDQFADGIEPENCEVTLQRAGFYLATQIGEEFAHLSIGVYLYTNNIAIDPTKKEFDAFVEVTFGGDRYDVYLMPTTYDLLLFLKEFGPLVESFNAVERHDYDLEERDKAIEKEWEDRRRGR
jgi:hypothetical protein